MPARIQVIGSLNVDFTTVTPRFPGPGETLTATSLTVNAGGKGANQCVACGRASFTSRTEQDVDVEMIGAVGADDTHYKSVIKPMLEESGVDCAGVTEIQGSQTGTATIIVDVGSGGENRILVVPGANHDGMRNASTILQQALSKETKPDMVVMQGEIPKETIYNLILELHDKTTIVLNPAPMYPEGIPRVILGKVQVLIANETEIAQVMANSSVSRMVHFSVEDGLKEPVLVTFANSLHCAGIRIIIVTLGSRGAFYSAKFGQGRIVEPCPVRKVVDTTAAGDTFVGTFCVALARHLFAHEGSLEGFDAHSAVLRANSQSAQCVQKAGAMQSIPWSSEYHSSELNMAGLNLGH